MHVTIYPALHGWFGPDDRQRLTPWGFRFGPVNAHGHSPLVREPLELHLTTLSAWEALLRALRYTAVVVGPEEVSGEHEFLLVLDP